MEHKSDINEERRRVSLLLENLRIDAQLLVLSMDSGKLPTYEILVNGAPSSEVIDNALRNEPWWTERHKETTERYPSARRQPNLGHHSRHQKRGSVGTQELAIKKRRTSSVLPQFSAPLSFRTNVPMPNHDDSTDSESEPSSDTEDQGSVLIMPKYSATTVFEDDDESLVGMISRKPSGSRASPPDFDSSTLPPRTELHNAGVPLNLPAPSPILPGSSSSAEAFEDVNESARPTISFAPAPPEVQHRASGAETPNLGFNDLPAKAQHLVINDLIRSQSQHTGVLFTTLPPPHAGTYKDERKSEDYLRGLAILCDMIPPCILIHSKSLTVTTAL